MTRTEQHLALASMEGWDLYLRDGASRSVLGRLRFLKAQGNRVSIIDYRLGGPQSSHVFHDTLADRGTPMVREGNVCQATYQGLEFHQEILPFRWEQFWTEPQHLITTVMTSIQQKAPDFVFTLDQDYYPLFAAWLLQIPGAHFFNAPHNVHRFARNPDYARCLGDRTVFANSRSLQAQVKAHLGLEPVVWHPFIDLDAYRAQRDEHRSGCIGFSSTQGRIKGYEIVAEIARSMPERSFIVVGGGCGKHSHPEPPNLTHWGHIADMKRFYGQIDLLLVPSLWREPFGRVILEAAANGIPVIANRVGGIPEALGDSGVLIDWEPEQNPSIAETAARYVGEIRRVLDDEDLYQSYSDKALARAREYEAEQARRAREIYETYICH